MLRSYITVILLLSINHGLRASDSIGVIVISTANQQFEFGGNNVSDVVTEVTERQGELSSLTGQAFTASLNYLGVAGSIVIDFSADGRSATLTIPSTGFTQDFSAASESKLNDELQDFLQKDGSAQLAEMRRQVNKESPVGITDGNPNSTTSLLASDFYEAMGLNLARNFPGAQTEAKNGFSFIASGSRFEAGSFNGWSTGGRVEYRHRFNPKLELVTIMPFSYYQIETSEIFGIGGGIGLPVAIIGKLNKRETRLTLAPFVGGMFRWSEDLAGGGALVSFGVNTTLAVPVDESWMITGLFQISDYRGVPFDVDGYELDNVVDQQIVKVGAQVIYDFNDWLLAELNLTGNRYLRTAAVQDWGSIGTGITVKLGQQWFVRCMYELNKGQDFLANTGSARIGLRF